MVDRLPDRPEPSDHRLLGLRRRPGAVHPGRLAAADRRADVGDPDLYLINLSLAAYGILLWQVFFPLFAWRPRLRPLLIGGAAVGWVGTALIFRLPLMGPALLVGCLSFVSPAGWNRLFD